MSTLIPWRTRFWMIPRRAPWSDIETLQDRLDRIWGRIPGVFPEETMEWLPAVDLEEKDDEFLLTAEFPGMSEKDVTVDVEGNTLTLRMALPGRDPMTIKPRLLVVEPARELRWKGRLFVPGLFDGEHAFVLTTLDNGRTRLDHWERFAGLLLPIARGMVYDDTVKSFHALNAALAKRAAAR